PVVVTRTYTVSESDVIIASCEQTITIVDTEAPVFEKPAELELTCYDAAEIATWLGSATATDNCGGEVVITTDYQAPVGECVNGTIPVIFTAEDECGN